MRALLICGILLFSGAATAQDRPSCLDNCDNPYVTCRQQCPGVGPECIRSAAQCAHERTDCKRQCMLQFPSPLLPPSKK
jgi:hypothetical protein